MKDKEIMDAIRSDGKEWSYESIGRFVRSEIVWAEKVGE